MVFPKFYPCHLEISNQLDVFPMPCYKTMDFDCAFLLCLLQELLKIVAKQAEEGKVLFYSVDFEI